MNFLEWKVLNESLSVEKLRELGKQAENFFREDGYKYMVPDFEIFVRKGEPIQQSVLFTNKKLQTFCLNYTKNGKLFSVDIWKPEGKKPHKTLYAENSAENEVLEITRILAKNPDFTLSRVKKNVSVLAESINRDPKLSDSKPEVSMDPDVQKAEKQIRDDYVYSDPETIFRDLEKYTEMVIKGVLPSLVITGSSGVGKTKTVLIELEKAGLKKDRDYVHIKGRSTAYSLFESLYENREKLIIYDDCDKILTDQDAVNILKGALDSYEEREISWLSKKSEKAAEKLPKTFMFEGQIIFISNLPQRKIDKAIKSRSFVLEVALRPEDMIKRMRDKVEEILPSFPVPLKEEAIDFIESIFSKVETLEVNMRTLEKAVKILQEIDELEVAQRLIIQQCSYK